MANKYFIWADQTTWSKVYDSTPAMLFVGNDLNGDLREVARGNYKNMKSLQFTLRSIEDAHDSDS